MRIIITSDTHGKHEELGILQGDVLIHCGDFCHAFDDDPSCVDAVDDWFGRQQVDLILAIGGNHDFEAQRRHREGHAVFHNAEYLVDQRYEWNGVVFYGSPWLPDLEGWANYLADNERRKKWDMIPDDTDVLMTHTPGYGVLDRPRSGKHIGCRFLSTAVQRVQPAVHCFGHVHASPGRKTHGGTESINATAVNSFFEIEHAPYVVERP